MDIFHHFPPDPRVDQLLLILATIKQEIQVMSQTNQQHVDAVAAQLAAMGTALTNGFEAILQEIADLKAQPQAEAMDFTGLDGAVTSLQTEIATVTAAAPPPPAPPAQP